MTETEAYLKGPVPLSWLVRAYEVGGVDALQTGLFLWYVAEIGGIEGEVFVTLPAVNEHEPCLKGPIPLSWLKKAYETGGSASVRTGIFLWFLVGVEKTKDNLVVNHKTAQDMMRISRHILFQGLYRLQAAGLITTRDLGKDLRATIVTGEG